MSVTVKVGNRESLTEQEIALLPPKSVHRTRDLVVGGAIALILFLGVIVVFGLWGMTESSPYHWHTEPVQTFQPPPTLEPKKPEKPSTWRPKVNRGGMPVLSAIAPDTLSPLAIEVSSVPSNTTLFGIGTIGVGGFGGGDRGNGSAMPFGPDAHIGDGRGLVLLMDDSRSMRKHSQRISEFIEEYYPHARQRFVKGCEISENSRPVIEIRKLAATPDVKSICYICDLQDPRDLQGLNQLQHILTGWKDDVRLDIVTYDQEAGFDLLMVVISSGGRIYTEKQLREALESPDGKVP